MELNRFCANHSQRTFELQCKQNAAWTSRKTCEMRCFLEGQGYGKNCSSEYREDHVCSVYQEKLSYAAAMSNCEKIGMQVCDRRLGADIGVDGMLSSLRKVGDESEALCPLRSSGEVAMMK